MNPVRTFMLSNKRWKLKWVATKNGWYGETDYDKKTITLTRDRHAKAIVTAGRTISTDELLMDTLIHELLHAASNDMLGEDFVLAFGRDAAKLLTRLGYKR